MALVLGLFLLAPYLGEYVLGNQPVTALPQLLLLAPMYGGGAILIREVGRRTAAGWPVMIILALAYALVEEGLIDQMIFNPAYLGLDSFEGLAPVPGLGISATLTLDSIALHAIGSTCAPIAIMEAFDREPPRPWLGRGGLTVVVVIFVLGSTALATMQALELRFVGTVAQFGITTAVIAALVVLAVRRAPRRAPADRGSPAPSTRRVGLGAFAVTTVFWLVDLLVPMITDSWVSVVLGTAVLVVGAVLLTRASRRPGFGDAHRLAAASGALSTYLWLAFVNTAQLGIPFGLGLLGNLVFGASAIVIMVVAHHAALRSSQRRPMAGACFDP